MSLVGQSFSMVDMVLLLHGNAQPISRIQPQLTEFFNQHYLQGREPTDANINVSISALLPAAVLMRSMTLAQYPLHLQ